MIYLSDILRAIAGAIETDSGVARALSRYEGAYRLVVGHAAEQEMQSEDARVVISVYQSAEPYDLGYVQERTASVDVRVSVWDKEQDADGIREDALGALACSDIVHAIAEAVKSISGMGDDLGGAQAVIDAAAWPHTVGTLALSVTWPVALASEATL